MNSFLFLIVVVLSVIFLPQRHEYDNAGSNNQEDILEIEASAQGEE